MSTPHLLDSNTAVMDAPAAGDVALTTREQVLELVHELRKPLQGIEAFARLLQGELSGDPVLTEYVDIVLSGARDLSTVFNRLIEFAGPDSIHREVVDVEEEFRSVCRLVIPVGARVKVTCACAADAQRVFADRQSLRQVFYNLIANAVEAMGSSGVLTLTTRRDGTTVAIALNDTGRGMSHREVRCATEPFWSLRRSGLGLGLSVVSKIACTHGGGLRIESSPGGPTTCEITIEEPMA